MSNPYYKTNTSTISNSDIKIRENYVFSLIKFIVFALGDLTQRIKCNINKSTCLEIWVSKNLIILFFLIIKKLSVFQFNSLMDFSFQDYLGKKNRFLPFYSLQSYTYNARCLIFSQIKEVSTMMSLTSLFESAGWLERESWDMFGVYFVGNRFMVRLLTDYGFVGFPLRKDFPLTGFVENFYDDYQKKVIYDNVELMQELRVFSLKSQKW